MSAEKVERITSPDKALLTSTASARPVSPFFGGADRLKMLRSAAHILVLDDEESNLRLVRRMLSGVGYSAVTTLTNPLELETAMEKIQPDLVITDLHMPARDGFDVLHVLQAQILEEHLPVLMVTGDSSIDVKHRALSMGARDFLTKPFDLIELTLRVRNQLETRLLYQDVRKQNRTLLDAVHGSTRDLEQARIELLERLAIAAEYRDECTSLHTKRVGEMSRLLAMALDQPTDVVALIGRAAPLHDIGKVGIPDALLRKPGSLTAEETAIMRTHTTIGAHILGGSQAPVLQLAEVIALSHHERWDGTGYCQQLSGADIPLAGRIVAVADTFDALTNDRPYRRARTLPQAIAEINSQSGGQFDPAVVAALARVLPMMNVCNERN